MAEQWAHQDPAKSPRLSPLKSPRLFGLLVGTSSSSAAAAGPLGAPSTPLLSSSGASPADTPSRLSPFGSQSRKLSPGAKAGDANNSSTPINYCATANEPGSGVATTSVSVLSPNPNTAIASQTNDLYTYSSQISHGFWLQKYSCLHQEDSIHSNKNRNKLTTTTTSPRGAPKSPRRLSRALPVPATDLASARHPVEAMGNSNDTLAGASQSGCCLFRHFTSLSSPKRPAGNPRTPPVSPGATPGAHKSPQRLLGGVLRRSLWPSCAKRADDEDDNDNDADKTNTENSNRCDVTNKTKSGDRKSTVADANSNSYFTHNSSSRMQTTTNAVDCSEENEINSDLKPNLNANSRGILDLSANSNALRTPTTTTNSQSNSNSQTIAKAQAEADVARSCLQKQTIEDDETHGDLLAPIGAHKSQLNQPDTCTYTKSEATSGSGSGPGRADYVNGPSNVSSADLGANARDENANVAQSKLNSNSGLDANSSNSSVFVAKEHQFARNNNNNNASLNSSSSSSLNSQGTPVSQARHQRAQTGDQNRNQIKSSQGQPTQAQVQLQSGHNHNQSQRRRRRPPAGDARRALKRRDTPAVFPVPSGGATGSGRSATPSSLLSSRLSIATESSDDDNNHDNHNDNYDDVDSRSPITTGSVNRPEVHVQLVLPDSGEPVRCHSQPVGSAKNETSGGNLAPAKAAAGVATTFKRLVKRQQSVDSYRMSRELRGKQMRRQQQQHQQQQMQSMATNATSGGAQDRCSGPFEGVASSPKASQLAVLKGAPRKASICAGSLAHSGHAQLAADLNLSAEPIALVESLAELQLQVQTTSSKPEVQVDEPEEQTAGESDKTKPEDQQQLPADRPTSLGLTTTTNQNHNSVKHPSQHNAFVLADFSGSITPTYPTFHLPSMHYVAPKKYSNASTISSTYSCQSSQPTTTTGELTASGQPAHQQQVHPHQELQNGRGFQEPQQPGSQPHTQPPTSSAPSDTESSALMNLSSVKLQQTGLVAGTSPLGGVAAGESPAKSPTELPENPEEVQRRAQLAEHIYDNKCGLGEEMKFLASLPELCDITFLVGETREPVCAVKSVLAARSRVFHKILFGGRARRLERQFAATTALQQNAGSAGSGSQDTTVGATSGASSRLLELQSSGSLGSDHPAASGALSGAAEAQMAPKKSPSPSGAHRSNSPSQAGWSVTLDASGLNATGSIHNRSGLAGQQTIQDFSCDTAFVIGAGQMATKVPIRRQKNSLREASQSGGRRLSRIFLKRISDPSIKHHNHYTHQPKGNHNMQNLASKMAEKHQAKSELLGSHGSRNSSVTQSSMSGQSSSQLSGSYLDKMLMSQTCTTMIIEEFEPDVFRQLIEYIHTGCVLLQARTLLGLLNAADYYGLDKLRKACLRFVSCCINVDTVCSLLATAERYIQYKCTKSIVQKVLEFVDSHADDIFKLNAFGDLPEHVVRLILSREALKADELIKFKGVYNWCEHYCRSFELANIADVMKNFLDLIQFHRIHINKLLSEIYPTHSVPDTIFLSALAFQAHPDRFEPQPLKARRMTLPNPVIYCNDDESSSPLPKLKANLAGLKSATSTDVPTTGDTQKSMGDSQQQLINYDDLVGAGSSSNLRFHDRKLQSACGHASMSSPVGGADTSGGASTSPRRASKLRKGSIAQVSLSGMMRLSHKLSIKRRYPRSSNQEASESKSGSRASTKKGSSGQRAEQDNEAVRLGRQILDAYLVEQRKLDQQRQQQLEREHQARRDASKTFGAPKSPVEIHQYQHHQATTTIGHGQAKAWSASSSQSRRSFRDFKHMSRKIFARHTSSSATGSTTGSSSAHKQLVASSSMSGVPTTAGSKAGAGEVSKIRRGVFRIKRSETVFESVKSSKEFS